MVQKKKKYISLKEASKISGYSADYIGYLIRTGKIEGRPVFTNIAWQTTPEAILAYKNKEHHRGRRKLTPKCLYKNTVSWFSTLKTTIFREIKLIFLFFKYFKKFLIVFSLLVILFVIVGIFLFQKTYNQSTLPSQRKVSSQTLTY